MLDRWSPGTRLVICQTNLPAVAFGTVSFQRAHPEGRSVHDLLSLLCELREKLRTAHAVGAWTGRSGVVYLVYLLAGAFLGPAFLDKPLQANLVVHLSSRLRLACGSLWLCLEARACKIASPVLVASASATAISDRPSWRNRLQSLQSCSPWTRPTSLTSQLSKCRTATFAA